MKFLNMQSKDVINVRNGKKIGYISDIEIDPSCFIITGICIEKNCYLKLISLFKGPPVIFIPKESIISIGEDVIIVNID